MYLFELQFVWIYAQGWDCWIRSVFRMMPLEGPVWKKVERKEGRVEDCCGRLGKDELCCQ